MLMKEVRFILDKAEHKIALKKKGKMTWKQLFLAGIDRIEE